MVNKKYPSDLRLFFVSEDDIKGDDPVLVNCIYHSEDDPSMAVYDHNIYCFGCKIWKGYYDFQRDLGDEAPELTKEIKKKEVKTYTQEELNELVTTYQRRLYLSDKIIYYKNRGLMDETIQRYRLGYTGTCFSIPIMCDSSIRTIRFRRDDKISPNLPKYWGLKGLNDVYLYAPNGVGERIVWCEGEFDTLILCQFGYYGVCLTNGIGNGCGPFLVDIPGVNDIAIAVDMDIASYMRSFDLAKEIHDYDPKIKVKFCRFDAKDITEAYLKYGRDYVRKVIG